MEIEKDLFYHYICTCLCTCVRHSVILGASGAWIQAVLPHPITTSGARRSASTRGTPGMVLLAPVHVGMEDVGLPRTRCAVTKPRAWCWTYAEKAKRPRAINLKRNLTRRLGGANTRVCEYVCVCVMSGQYSPRNVKSRQYIN